MQKLSPEELRQLSQPSGLRASLTIAGDWLLIALNFAAVIYVPHILTYIICFILAARHQLAFAVLMHDGSHRRLFKSTKINDWVGQFTVAAPLFFSMYSYQKLHLKHHREPLAPDDPDLSLTGGYPVSKASFLRKILRDAFGISYFKFIRYFLYMARENFKKSAALKAQNTISGENNPTTSPQTNKLITVSTKGGLLSLPTIIFSILLVNGLMILALSLWASAWLYVFFWLLPMFTVLQVLLRIRGITEHSGYQPNPDQRLNARTVVNPIQTFFFAPHNVNYHIEHHIYPAVPFFNLPRLHKIFLERNLIPPQNLYRGYRQVLRELVK